MAFKPDLHKRVLRRANSRKTLNIKKALMVAGAYDSFKRKTNGIRKFLDRTLWNICGGLDFAEKLPVIGDKIESAKNTTGAIDDATSNTNCFRQPAVCTKQR